MKESKYLYNVNLSVEFLKKWHEKAPEICIVLGSGLSEAIPGILNMKFAKFSDIPGFKNLTVAGHKSDIRIGNISDSLPNGVIKSREIIFLRGRNHAYEGNDPGEVVHNIRSLMSWGVKGIILTNAAGCLQPQWELGKMMIVTDHINATGLSPVNGQFGEGFGPQFIDMSSAYALDWQKQIQEIAVSVKHKIYSGIYYGVLGAQYETPAEIRMMQSFGASAVGMSTVLETIAARQMGVKTIAISCLTNYAAGLKDETLKHSDVMDMGARFSHVMADIVLKAAVTLEI